MPPRWGWDVVFGSFLQICRAYGASDSAKMRTAGHQSPNPELLLSRRIPDFYITLTKATKRGYVVASQKVTGKNQEIDRILRITDRMAGLATFLKIFGFVAALLARSETVTEVIPGFGEIGCRRFEDDVEMSPPQAEDNDLQVGFGASFVPRVEETLTMNVSSLILFLQVDHCLLPALPTRQLS